MNTCEKNTKQKALRMDKFDETFCPEVENINELSGRKIIRTNSNEISHVKNAEHPGVIEHLSFIKKLLNEYLTNSYSKESKLLNVILKEMEIFNLTNCGRIARNIYNENINLIKIILNKSLSTNRRTEENKKQIMQEDNEKVNLNLSTNYSQTTATKYKPVGENYFTLSYKNVAQLSTLLNVDVNKFKVLLSDIITGKINVNILKSNNIYLLNNNYEDTVASETDKFMDPYTENIDYFMRSLL